MPKQTLYPFDLDEENSGIEDYFPSDLGDEQIYLEEPVSNTSTKEVPPLKDESLKDRAASALNSDIAGDAAELALSLTKVGGPVFSSSKTLGDSTLTGTEKARKNTDQAVSELAASAIDGYRVASPTDLKSEGDLSVNICDTIYSEVKNEIFKYEKYGESDIVINGVREKSICGVNSKYFPKEYARLKEILSTQKEGVMSNEDLEEIHKIVYSVIRSLMNPILKGNSVIIATSKEAQRDIIEYIGVTVKAMFLAPSVANSYFRLSGQNFLESCNQPTKNANGLYNYMMKYFKDLDKRRNTNFSGAYERRFKEKTIIA